MTIQDILSRSLQSPNKAVQLGHFTRCFVALPSPTVELKLIRDFIFTAKRNTQGNNLEMPLTVGDTSLQPRSGSGYFKNKAHHWHVWYRDILLPQKSFRSLRRTKSDTRCGMTYR